MILDWVPFLVYPNLFEIKGFVVVVIIVVKVRSTARACYWLFSKTWPDRSHHLFESFEPARQKVQLQNLILQ
jgi:muramidase (phage lysozyme)